MTQIPNPQNEQINFRFGHMISLSTAIITLLTFAIAICTPPISGPFCEEGCIDYPYVTDIVSRFPRDYYWMFGAMVVTLLYIVLMLNINQLAIGSRKIFGRIGVAFSIIAATVLFTDYFIQVFVIQASLVNGETAGLVLWTQYNPHGIFIALEEVGYILMCFSFFSVVPVFSKADPWERAIRWTFTLGFLLSVLAFILITFKYGLQREYYFEVAIISFDWLMLIVAGFLISKIFKNALVRHRRT